MAAGSIAPIGTGSRPVDGMQALSYLSLIVLRGGVVLPRGSVRRRNVGRRTVHDLRGHDLSVSFLPGRSALAE